MGGAEHSFSQSIKYRDPDEQANSSQTLDGQSGLRAPPRAHLRAIFIASYHPGSARGETDGEKRNVKNNVVATTESHSALQRKIFLYAVIITAAAVSLRLLRERPRARDQT